MAYISQEDKARLAPKIKAILKKYGLKGSIAIRHYSTLVVNIRSGSLDIIGNWWEYRQTHPTQADYTTKPENIEIYGQHGAEDRFTGKVQEFVKEIMAAMRGENYHNRSDIMTDYFDVSHYYTVNIGKWDKPYQFTQG